MAWPVFHLALQASMKKSIWTFLDSILFFVSYFHISQFMYNYSEIFLSLVGCPDCFSCHSTRVEQPSIQIAMICYSKNYFCQH